MLSRRTFVSLAAASAAASKLAAAQPVLREAAPSGPPPAAPSFYQKGNVRIRYQEVGSGFPLLVTPGGGLNSCMAKWPTAVFNAPEEFKGDFRCITMDQRNANDGESTGPIPVDDPWGAFADDQLGLMDHLGIQKFFFMGYCIGGPFAMKLMQRAPDRVAAAVLCQPVGHRPENPDVMYNPARTIGPRHCSPTGPTSTWRKSTHICTTSTACSPTLFTAWRATLRAPARRRCWSCRTTPRHTHTRLLSTSRRWRQTPRSRSIPGKSPRS
jgi:pimeloyl-ACP methyl ester carboxylesterase